MVYELVYLHPFTDEKLREHDIEKVRSVPGGYLIRLTAQTVQFIPSHRIISESMPVSKAVDWWSVGRAWLKEAKEK